MQLGVVSDIHSNRVAFEAVLDDMPAVDGYVCAGDVVGYGPWPAECLDLVRDLDAPTVMGNHDRAVATGASFSFNSMAAAGAEYSRDQLSEEQVDWLYALPTERTEFEGRVKIVHGHPDDPDRYTYPSLFKADLLDDEDVLVMGHTHVQAHEAFDEGIVMNPGSVGQPRDGDPRAAYAIVDLDAMTVEEHRVEYDIAAVEEAVADAGLPAKIGKRLHRGR
ncbi:metallophosphoesterase family protein [Halorientalis brevis]|uniref:Phosphoesterase n=1 Tax=Halorientalis brevis TaxID=1126241 RepID=A0ABD6C9P6_9EURY|nr:metallophosphoesterase family protein [Halorientalis brevis]